MKKIGGFFPLHLPEKKKGHSFLSLWNIEKLNHSFFSNGRSALSHFLADIKPKTLWLPAYSCDSIREAAAHSSTNFRFYPMLPGLSPDCRYLERHIKPKDAVLAIDYFGRNPFREFIDFVSSTPDIVWIEDRAQAILPSRKAWGDVVLYSPRKILGVPDGGIIVSKRLLPHLKHEWNSSPDFIHASLLRYEDIEEEHNSIWHSIYQTNEKRMTISSYSMSRISYYILASTDPRPLIKKRHENYDYLMKELKEYSLMPAKDRSFVPFGFPIRTKNKDKLTKILHENKIFAAHHWPELPSNPKEFPGEHLLSEQLLTLPVDHRYDTRDMKRIINFVLNVLS